jgi:hypothetical protein
MEKMLPYLGDKVYSDAVPTIELRPFRECFGRAIFSMMRPADRADFEHLVSSGEIYDNNVITRLTRFFNSAIDNQEVKGAAAKMCPQYASAIASM